MASYNYSFKSQEENIAKVVGRDIGISHKTAIEICNQIRGKDLQKAKRLMSDVMIMKRAIEFKRFTNGPGHKRGMGSGRYPISACTEILKLLKSVEANAQFKGLNTGNLNIVHISAQKGSDAWHYGRLRRRKMKRVNLEIVVMEKPKKDDRDKRDVKEKTEEKKTAVKTEEKKKEEKTEIKKDVEKTKVEEVKAKEEKVTKVEKKEMPKEKKTPTAKDIKKL